MIYWVNGKQGLKMRGQKRKVCVGVCEWQMSDCEACERVKIIIIISPTKLDDRQTVKVKIKVKVKVKMYGRQTKGESE